MKVQSSCISLLSVSASLLKPTMAASLRGSLSSRSLQDYDNDNDSEDIVNCRMLMMGTQFVSSDPVEQPACVPIVDGEETSDLIPLDLPDDIESTHASELEQGQLFVTITDATLFEGEIYTSNSTAFIVSKQTHGRHLQNGESLTTGDMTVAVVRIATSDSRCSLSNRDIDAMFDESKANFVTQFNKCSFGKLRFQKAQRHIIDVKVNESVSKYYGNPIKLVNKAQDALLNTLRVNRATDIADKIIMCVPSGTGSWVASAGVRHWRTQFNNEWTRSLSANMHELGHNIGLLHANQNREEYADSTGYMGRSYTHARWPLRCFNGRNNHVLGWYNEMKFDPTTSTSHRLIDLSGFVHYDQSNTVLVNLANQIFLQYNRAALFNAHSGEMKDRVTVTLATKGGSELLGGIAPGEVFEIPYFKGTLQTLVIRACGEANKKETPEKVTISVGMDEASCEPDPAQVAMVSLLQKILRFLSFHLNGGQ